MLTGTHTQVPQFTLPAGHHEAGGSGAEPVCAPLRALAGSPRSACPEATLPCPEATLQGGNARKATAATTASCCMVPAGGAGSWQGWDGPALHTQLVAQQSGLYKELGPMLRRRG